MNVLPILIYGAILFSALVFIAALYSGRDDG